MWRRRGVWFALTFHVFTLGGRLDVYSAPPKHGGRRGEHMRDVHLAQLWYPECATVPASQAQQSEVLLTQETLIFDPTPCTSTPVKIEPIPVEDEPPMAMDKEQYQAKNQENILPKEEEETNVVHPPRCAKHCRIAPVKRFSFEGPKDVDCTSITEDESTVTVVVKEEVHSITIDADLEAKKSTDAIVIDDDTM